MFLSVSCLKRGVVNPNRLPASRRSSSSLDVTAVSGLINKEEGVTAMSVLIQEEDVFQLKKKTGRP